MSDKSWLRSYPDGIPTEVPVDTYASLAELIERSCERFSRSRAYSSMGTALSYGEVADHSAAFAAWLQQRAGLARGDRLAIMMPNVLQYPVALFGTLRAGLTVVNVNPLYTARELRHQLRDSGARAVVILENFAHTLADVIGDTPIETVVTTRVGDLLPAPRRWVVNAVVKHVKRLVPDWNLPGATDFPTALSQGTRLTLEPVPLTRDDTAFLQYTGGTTGAAKGAILTHGNIVANVEQVSAWLSRDMHEGREVIVTALPLYHIFSLLANCFLFLKLGGENVLITNPRDLKQFVKTLSGTPFTVITGVNTLFNGLLNTPAFAKLDFGSLRFTLGGGMAVQRKVAERWQATTGTTLLEAYGLTETSPAVCINPVSLEAYNASIGLPIPSTEVSIRSDDGEPMAVNEVGELCVRGPQVTPGYWNHPDETRSAFFADGYFRSGDMARMDENGFVYIVDRKKDMIIVSGFNVYPNEVEDVIVQHPDVLEAAVIGIPDESQGERLKAFIVAGTPDLPAEAIVAHCRTALTGYKVPHDIEFRDELPKSNVGKILRRSLRDEHADGSSRAA